MGFFVSRQNYFYSNVLVVEIEIHGLDYAGADMLGVEYANHGEGKEFDDPCDALKAAIAIRDEWKKVEPEIDGITFGTSGGMGFEGEPLDCSDEDLFKIAIKHLEQLPKCDCCGKILGVKTYKDSDNWHLDEAFCSERCLEKSIESRYIEDHKEEWKEAARIDLAEQTKAYVESKFISLLRGKHAKKRERWLSRLKKISKERIIQLVIKLMSDRELRAYEYAIDE